MQEVSESEVVGAEAVDSDRSAWRRVLRTIGVIFLWLLFVLGAMLLGAAFWIRQTFGPISVDQMLMNMAGGGEGVPARYITTAVNQILLIPLACVAFIAIVFILLVRLIRRKANQRWSTSAKIARTLFVIAAFSTGLAVFAQAVNLPQYVRSVLSPYNMEDYYVVPETGGNGVLVGNQNAGEVPKNLVVIVLESGEESYSNEHLFGLNMNESLEAATADWQRFDTLDTYNGGGWTMAGLVGTECGVPLRGPGRGADDLVSNSIGENSDSYLPGAVCLGDVLSDAGYRNVFMGGADASFSGKEKYLRTHGYDEIKDLRTWLAEGETDTSEWALSDHRLMERAKEEITTLHESGQPFHLTLLTIDPHEPLHQYDYCPSISDEPMTSVIHCSMGQVAGFVDYMRQMGYLDDTAVFITGDHPKMIGEGMSIYADELLPLESRPLFNRLWDPDGAQIQRTSVDQLSSYATLLDVLGLGRSDHRAGIGVSALVSVDGFEDDSSVTSLTGDQYSELIQSRSTSLYQKLWATEPHSASEARE